MSVLIFSIRLVQAEIGRLDPNGDSFGTGLLGRISDSLTSNSYNVNAFSIDTSLVALQGNDLDIVKSSVNSRTGFKHFNPSAPNSNLTQNMLLLNGGEREKNGIFSEFWSSSLVSTKLIDFDRPLFYQTSILIKPFNFLA